MVSKSSKRKMQLPGWKIFESNVAGQLKTRKIIKSVLANQKIRGIYSRSLRQIDGLATTKLNDRIVIECKFYDQVIDVPRIDSFIGFLLDVNVSWGILVTNQGFTKGARLRAVGSTVQLDVMSPEMFERVFSGEVLAWGRFVVRCNGCRHSIERFCNKLDFEIVEVNERTGGEEYCHSANWTDNCPKCRRVLEVRFDLWEYPWGSPGDLETVTTKCTLSETGHFLVNRDAVEEQEIEIE